MRVVAYPLSLMYDKEQKVFVPYEELPPNKRRQICESVKADIDELLRAQKSSTPGQLTLYRGSKKAKNQDIVGKMSHREEF